MSAKDSYWFQSPTLSWIPVHAAAGGVTCSWTHPVTHQPIAIPAGEVSAAQLQSLKRAVHSTTCQHSDDLVSMEDVTEGSLLHNLRMRFASDLIYTNVGPTLISINPFKPVPLYTEDQLDRYSRLPANSLPPHIFATSAECVRDLQSHRRSQSVVISGESGSGKSEATKLLIMFFTKSASKDSSSAALMARFLSNVQSRDATLTSAASSSDTDGSSADITTKILEAGPVLESLGNAKTVRNNNSSRFGKWISLMFDASNQITSCSISCYLLEKSRIVQKGPGERNFHSLYQLCAGADHAFKSKYGVTDAASHEYTRSNVMTVPNMDDAMEWRQLLRSLEILSFDEAERDGFARILTGVLLLGDVTFTSSAEGNAVVAEPAKLTGIAAALGVEEADLNRVLTTKTFSASRRSIHTLHLSPAAAVDSRNALSKMLYAALFEYTAFRIDEAMGKRSQPLPPSPQTSSFAAAVRPVGGASSDLKIGILDIFGYENFTTNSLEQLCINLANERIHQLYNQYTFDGEKALFASEGISAPSSLTIAYVDNSAAIEAICGKASIFAILDDECNVPKGSDDNIAPAISQLALRLSTGAHWNKEKPLLSVTKIEHEKFTVAHYAGDVQYTTSLWLDKNRDSLSTDISIVMGSSTVHFLVAAVACLTADSLEDKGLKDAAVTLSSKKNKASLTKKFSMQLVDLVSNIRSGELHFIRCIKPNHLLAPATFDGNFINTQLRYSGMMAAVDVRRLGFPVRMPLKEFHHQFQPLALSSQSSSCHTLVTAFGFSQEDCQVGSSMVFMKDGVFHSLRARLLVIQAQRLVTIQCCFRCSIARRCCKRRRWATLLLQSRYRCTVAYASTKRKLVTLYLNDAVIACDEALLNRYLSMAQEEQEGVAPARRKLMRIAETREFIQGLKQYHACEDVDLLESIINESRKLEVANHEAVRVVAAQLDRAKRIVIVQQAIASAVTRSNISDLDISIATALQLVGHDRDWIIEANKSRQRLEAEARIRTALETRELGELQEAERLAETLDTIAAGLLEEIRHTRTIVQFEHDLAVAVDRQDVVALKPLLEKAASLDHRAEFMMHKAGILMNAHETKQQLSQADKITDVAELCKVISRAQRFGVTESDTNLRAAVNQFKSLVLQKVTPESLKEMQVMASNGLLTNSIRDDDVRARLTQIAKDAANRLSGKSALAGEDLLSLERQLSEAVAAKNVDKLRFLLFQAQRSGADSPAVRGARSSLQSVLELSNARKALSALLEQDSDGYTISAAIEHARRVGVDTEVLNAASVIAQERAQKRLLIQNLKTGLSADPARQRAILQPFVEEARSLGLSHDIVDAAQAKLKALAEEEQKASAIIQESFLQLLDNFISHLLNPDSVVPNSLQDSLVLFAQQYSMQNCFLCLQTPSLKASASVPSANDDRPCQPLTSLPAAATASAIYIGRCIVWFTSNKGDSFSASLLSEILKTVIAGPACLRTEAWMFICQRMSSASDVAVYSRLALLAFVFARNFSAEKPALPFAISTLLSGIISSSESVAVEGCRHPPSLQTTTPLLLDSLRTIRLNISDTQRLPPLRHGAADLAELLPVTLLPLAKLDAVDA